MEKSSGSSTADRLRSHHSEKRGSHGSSGRHTSYDSINQKQQPQRKCRGGTLHCQKQTQERQIINTRSGDQAKPNQSNRSEQGTVRPLPAKRPQHHYTRRSTSRKRKRSISAHKKGATRIYTS